MVTTLAFAAATWGIAMAMSPLLQIRAVVASRTAVGVSIAYQAVLLVGFVLWLAYGIADDNLALIVPNAVAAVVSVATILVIRHYRRQAVTRPALERPLARGR
jgi:uncharacterized protein with PQ loop repeat